MTTTTITRLTTAPAYAVLPAEDLGRARSFYHDVLGLELSDSSDGQFFIHAGSDTKVLVYERPRTVAEHTAMTFLVDDLRATVTELRSRGVVFEEYDMPGLKTVDGIAKYADGLGAWFTDPEGNIINIAQMS
jgi:catechol 2,3-dioxygenase-like lactoylglutathione lyase family enzyme